MNSNTLEKILSKHGNFASIEWNKTCKVYKNVEEVITKTTSATSVQIGASYDSKKVTMDKRENGELPSENQGLNGLEWVKFPYILKNPKTNKMYLRIETTQKSKFISKFFVDGNETSKDLILDKLQASEKSSRSEMPIVMNIPLDGIVAIH